ncbi:hypothetical protein [Maribacter sp. ACAM166]|uniref:hypothetical protein n=1 Tax=Maribacter sp. ACAM166 TaxID=2508996 RepID=UPI0010FE2F3B|nr:hypothetical protein [Maribacter sp. ACAM166]TLP79633.1 hypothetical protein ES765_10330 [Maribacter sp. ACAM166]
MSFVRNKILNPLVAIILLVGLLGPYFVKISHALYEHEELHCASKDELHVHAVEFNCDFEHYHLSTFFYPEFNYPHFLEVTPITKAIINNYYYLSKYQQLHFVLRGPPTC